MDCRGSGGSESSPLPLLPHLHWQQLPGALEALKPPHLYQLMDS